MQSCKEYVEYRKEFLKNHIEKNNKKIRLDVIQLGDNPASNSYIKGKQRDCEDVGIECKLHKLPIDTPQNELNSLVEELNNSELVHGIIIQLPLPRHINIKEAQKFISSEKDVDGFLEDSKHIPCTPKGVVSYLAAQGFIFPGRKVVVVGRSDIVGKPLAKLLLDLDCTVTVCHSKTPIKDQIEYIKNSDIAFLCTNKIEQYKGYDYFPNLGALHSYATDLYMKNIVDIGLGRGADGKLHGNLEHEYLELLRKYQTKNQFLISGTGGVGLLTRLQLLENVVSAHSMLGVIHD